MRGLGFVGAVAMGACLSLAGCATPSDPGPTSQPSASQASSGVTQASSAVQPSCACSYPPTPPPGAISREAAVASALRAVPGAGTATQVLWADVYPDPFASHTVPSGGTPLPESQRQVWMVRLQGPLAIGPCPGDTMPTTAASSTDGPCLDGEGGVDVVLDILTGELLGWTH